jgi:hypothetical protein
MQCYPMLEIVSHGYAPPGPCLVAPWASGQCLAAQSAEGQLLLFSMKLFENEILIFCPN